MKKRTSKMSSPDTITNSAEVLRMNLDLVAKLALALVENEKAQRRFRNAVLIRLSNIETVVQRIHGVQIVEAQHCKPVCPEKARKDAEDAEKFISENSKELGLAMVRYIYGESESPETQRDAQRKQSG